MNKYMVLISCAFILLALNSNAQDKMYKKNGEIIEIKVLQITPEIITFKRFENLDGPEYSIPKGDVLKIKYANGSSDVFEENNDKLGVNDQGKSIGAIKYMDRKSAPKDYNIISAAPLQFSENGYGFSISYERSLDKRGWVSFYCPAILTYSNTGNSYNSYTNTTTYNTFSNPMYYIEPGVKIYTNLNSNRKVKWSIGPSVVLGMGMGVPTNIDLQNNGGQTAKSRLLIGTLVNVGGNVFPSPHIYMGFDMGYGISYLNNYDGINNGTSLIFQMSFRIGYKFCGKK